MASETAQVSIPQIQNTNQREIPALATIGKYSVYPMEYSTEDDVAKSFSKICQRGNPVLQGRAFSDLVLLGKAMYRKANLLSTGQVVVHKGEVVALGFGWDMAEGGVWQNSGLEMPASLAAHAAIGKAAFEQYSFKKRGETFFGAFYGVLPPHNGVFFGYLGVSAFMMAYERGFKDAFQYTLLPTLQKREGTVFGKFAKDDDNMNWHVDFADVAASADKAVADEICNVSGTVNLSLTNLDYAINGKEWMARSAATVRLESADHLRRPSQQIATNHGKWLRQIQSTNAITSRL